MKIGLEQVHFHTGEPVKIGFYSRRTGEDMVGAGSFSSRRTDEDGVRTWTVSGTTVDISVETIKSNIQGFLQEYSFLV